MSLCVIVGGAYMNNYEYIRSRLSEDDYIIDNPHLDVEIIMSPSEKDDTDTAFAVNKAIKGLRK